MKGTKEPLDLVLIIPAHNEEMRIELTLKAYYHYFSSLSGENQLNYTILVVLNGCSDNTLSIVKKMADELNNIMILYLEHAGKGYAIAEGFKQALKQGANLIGFVDADMATEPNQFFNLILHIKTYDGIVASRYMPDSVVIPPRPRIKRWGSRIVFEPLIKLLFGMHYVDFQCGAKLFKRHVIETVVNHLTIRQWAFDVELLYLCKKCGFLIKELPTVWYDKTGSKFALVRSGVHMLSSIVTLRFAYRHFAKQRDSIHR